MRCSLRLHRALLVNLESLLKNSIQLIRCVLIIPRVLHIILGLHHHVATLSAFRQLLIKRLLTEFCKVSALIDHASLKIGVAQTRTSLRRDLPLLIGFDFTPPNVIEHHCYTE